MNLQAHGEIKARQEWFWLQGALCVTQSAFPGCRLAFCCFSPCFLHSHAELSSPSITDFLAFQFIFDIPGAIWGKEAQDRCRYSHLCFLSLSMLSVPGQSIYTSTWAFCVHGLKHLEAEWMSWRSCWDSYAACGTAGGLCSHQQVEKFLSLWGQMAATVHSTSIYCNIL